MVLSRPVLVSALLSSLALSPALAQSASQDDRDGPIDVITVEAAKVPTSTGDITAKVTVIDNERIERELAQTIDDLIRYEPGINVADQGSRFGFSGFNIRGVGGNRVLVEVDGVATSDSFEIGSFSNASRDFVDVNSLKQVEIVRGPASALFGSDALGGVVSLVTRGPYDYLGNEDFHADVSAGYNSVDDSKVVAGTLAARSGNWAGMLRATRREGGERDIELADPMEDESLNIVAKLVYGVPGDGAIGLTLERFNAETETDVVSRQGVQDFTPVFGFPFIVDTTSLTGDDERERTRISIDQQWTNGAFGTDFLRWRVYRQESDTLQNTRELRDTLVFGAPGALERNRVFDYNQELAGLEINAANSFSWGGTSHQIAYGLEFENTDTAQIRDGSETDLIAGTTTNVVTPDVFPVRDFPVSTLDRIGIYVQDRISFGNVTVIPGLRFDRFELDPELDDIFIADNPGIDPVSIDESQVSPKLGALWQVNSDLELFAQYAEGFRAPPVNDVNIGFTNLTFGYTAIPNPDLEAESSQGFEVGARYANNWLELNASVFQTRYDDFIQSTALVNFDPIQNLLIFQSINVDEVEIEGIELSGRVRPASFPEGLSIGFTAAYADGEDRNSGQPINTVAPLNGVVGLDYAAPSGIWGISGIARASAAADDLDETAQPLLQPTGYVIYDLLGFWQPTRKLRVRGGLYNATDHEYTAYLDVQNIPADVTNPERFQRPGRHLSIAVDWMF
ncbi:MAG: TonB-dependent hemoglobin/transferrin/lactoferrin family receptor [Pseudomonadota bacterium]